MFHSTDLLFRTMFDQMPEPRLVIEANAPEFRIVTINKAYASATGHTAEELSGQSLWTVFSASNASMNVRSIFEQGLNDAIQHHSEMKLPIFRSDVAATATERAKPRWWQVDVLPISDDSGKVAYLLCTTRNVTIHVEDQAEILRGGENEAALLVRQQENAEQISTLQGQLADADQHTELEVAIRTKELSDSEYELSRVIAVTPVGLCILKGNDHIIKTANKPILDMWGRQKEKVLGFPLLEVLPELNGQPFPAMLKKVIADKKALILSAQPVMVIRSNGTSVRLFVDLSYDPLFDVEGAVEGVLVTVNDVTQIIEARDLLQERQEELETMNEELEAMNEELEAMNEELNSVNEELQEANQKLNESK